MVFAAIALLPVAVLKLAVLFASAPNPKPMLLPDWLPDNRNKGFPAYRRLPLRLTSPATSSFDPGVMVPIPTLPVLDWILICSTNPNGLYNPVPPLPNRMSFAG